MLTVLNSPGVWPFSLALLLLAAALFLEVVLLFLGNSGMVGVDAPDLDAELDAEPDMGGADGLGAVVSWLGIGKVPVLIWALGFLAGFALSGIALQSAVSGLLGAPLPALAAAIAALPPALLFAKITAGWVGRLIPRTETAAISARGLSGLRGTITQGTARRGMAAEARVRDRHGNLHHLRVEPYEDGVSLPEGTDVAIIRTRDGSLRALSLSDD